VKERECYYRGETEPAFDKLKQWFWEGVGVLAIAVGAVLVVKHLPEIISLTAQVVHHA